jgi:uncharacterized protein
MVRAVADDAAADRERTGEDPEHPVSRSRGRDLGVAIVALVVLAAALFRPLLEDLLDRPAIAHWATVFVAIVVQAMPFLVLGVTISAGVAAFVPGDLLARILPSRPSLAVPAAAAAGVALPGCECGSVPIAARLVDRGMLPAAALAFLLSAPAINPIVLVATAVAFPGRPEVVVARFIASLIAATLVGLIWARTGHDELLRMTRRRAVGEGSPLSVMMATAQHDLLNAGGFLIIGAGTAATLQTVVPRSALETLGGAGVLAFLAMSGLAVIMAICSEADAFVAASLSQFSLTARLAFLLVGPMVDLKLMSMQAGVFGRRFAFRFAPTTFVAAVAVAGGLGVAFL